MTPQAKSLRLSFLSLALTLSAPLFVNAQSSSEFSPELLAPAPQGKAWEPAWGFWSKAPPASWQQTHWSFVNQAKKGGVDVLFLGDSITKGWAGAGKEIWARNYQPLKALNIGIGGDTTRQTLWRIDHDALEGIQPKVVVLMIGVNNIFTGTGTDEEIARGVNEIVKQIHARRPAAKILLTGILPLGNQGQSEKAARINRLLAANQPSFVRFLDLTATFQQADGTVVHEYYSPDLIHLAEPGYATWDKAMRPMLIGMLR
jgi:platelet-activating factor acetylhydrolase IB subunit beta/gamma